MDARAKWFGWTSGGKKSPIKNTIGDKIYERLVSFPLRTKNRRCGSAKIWLCSTETTESKPGACVAKTQLMGLTSAVFVHWCFHRNASCWSFYCFYSSVECKTCPASAHSHAKWSRNDSNSATSATHQGTWQKSFRRAQLLVEQSQRDERCRWTRNSVNLQVMFKIFFALCNVASSVFCTLRTNDVLVQRRTLRGKSRKQTKYFWKQQFFKMRVHERRDQLSQVLRGVHVRSRFLHSLCFFQPQWACRLIISVAQAVVNSQMNLIWIGGFDFCETLVLIL